LHIDLPFLGIRLSINRMKRSGAHKKNFSVQHGWYESDGLRVLQRSLDALDEPRFREAYRQGMDSGHKICRAQGSKTDINIDWRVYTCCWAAQYATRLAGDFVECGVNTGIISLAVCHYVNFASLEKKFYLFDTYEGIPVELMSDGERQARMRENQDFYSDCYELTRQNFAPFPNAQLVKGMVPASLDTVDIPSVAYLSIDMNIAAPEIAAMEHFWERLVPGGIVVFDDYGFLHYREQYLGLNEFARQRNVQIYTLPTGQGLLLKPP